MPKPATPKKLPKIGPLRCLGPDCGGFLAYEVTAGNVLYVDLAYQAQCDGELRFFPCPKCLGRNVVEEMVDGKGVPGHRVTRFVPSG